MSTAKALHGTTILAVRHRGGCAIAGDGQVTMGRDRDEARREKIRRLHNGQVLAGFAGSTADAMALFTKFEAKIEEYRGNLERAAVELAKEWRTDRVLRRLEAFLIVADRESSLPPLRRGRRHRARRRDRGRGQRRLLRPGRGPRPRPPHRARRRRPWPWRP